MTVQRTEDFRPDRESGKHNDLAEEIDGILGWFFFAEAQFQEGGGGLVGLRKVMEVIGILGGHMMATS
jgi:hypothetical protein